MIFEIDGKDFSHILSKRGYEVLINKIEGANKVITLDGKTHEDILATKMVVNVPVIPLNNEQTSELMTAVANCKRATFLDTRNGEIVTKRVSADLSGSKLVFNAKGRQYWGTSEKEGMTLTLQEL